MSELIAVVTSYEYIVCVAVALSGLGLLIIEAATLSDY